MPLINRIKEMQQQGLNENEIMQKLRDEGTSPLDINQGLEQSRIKSAIYPPEAPMPYEEFSPNAPSQEESGEMQPGMMDNLTAPAEIAPEQPETPEYIYPTPQAYYPQYQEYQSSSAETITEIAESVAEEKLNKLRKDSSSLQQFKETAERKIKDMDDRLKRIEEIIDKLQATIIGKIGGFGSNIDSIKQEMEMMQESFSKALPNFARKARSREETKPEHKEHKPEHKSKRKSAIEHYLRR